MTRDWDREPTRQELRARGPEATPHRSRKNRRRWCGGKVGREHQPVIRISKWGLYRLQRDPDKPVCHWQEKRRWETTPEGRRWVGTGEWRWRCDHEDGCDRCGKVLDSLFGVGKRCPDYQER